MRKICLAVILALTFPAALVWAEEDAVPETFAPTPVAVDEAREPAESVLVAANGSETSRVTTFKYNRPTQADSEAREQKEPKQLQRSHSRPKVVTYGSEGSAPAAEESRPVRRGQSEPKVTTFEYKRPAPAQPAEAVETKKPEPAPKAAKRPKRTRTADAKPEPAPAAKTVESKPEPASDRARPRPADDEPPVPPKDETRFTTLNQRTEELAMAKPEAAASRGRAARVRAARQKAEAAPPLATPAYDGTSFNVAGIYVNCPKNKEENCGPASEEFRYYFPKDQTAPYVMIRKDGRGYVAPDSKRTVAFTWQFLGDNALLIIMEDSKHRKIEYRTEGRYLRSMATGDLFYLSLTDAEWNVEPEPYSKIKARREKAKK